MKNKLKFFGIIVMIAVIGFSMTACGDGGGDDGGDGKKIFYVVSYNSYTGDIVVAFAYIFYSEDEEEAKDNAIIAITEDDVVFTPNDVVTITDFIPAVNTTGMTIKTFKLKTGIVTVTLKDKNGYSFVKASAKGSPIINMVNKDCDTFTVK